MRRLVLIGLFFCLIATPVLAQIGMGGQPHPSAMLDLKSPANDKAFYPPRLTTAQRKAIVDPQAGAFVYDTDQNTFFFFDGHAWNALTPQAPGGAMPVTRTLADGGGNERFGFRVALSGDYALVSASGRHQHGIMFRGVVYVFQRTTNGWAQQPQLLMADDAAMFDSFGTSIAFDGNTALIGATGVSNQQGAVYVFTRSGNTWTQQQRLTASDAAPIDHFGFSVALSGNLALIGASRKTNGGNLEQGAVYVFTKSGGSWNQTQKLLANDGATGDAFGTSVALSGNLALIGAPGKIINAIRSGAAYAFQLNPLSATPWTQRQRLTPSNPSDHDWFGESVALDNGAYAFVGAPEGRAPGGSISGIVEVFSGTAAPLTGVVSWAFQQQLLPEPYDLGYFGGSRLGTSLSVSGTTLLVGAPGLLVSGNDKQGGAYVYRRSGAWWSLVRKITDLSAPYTRLGSNVALSGSRYVLGGFYFQNFQGKAAFGFID